MNLPEPGAGAHVRSLSSLLPRRIERPAFPGGSGYPMLYYRTSAIYLYEFILHILILWIGLCFALSFQGAQRYNVR